MKMGAALNRPEDSRSYSEDDSLAMPKLLMGVEVEIEEGNRNLIETFQNPFWEVKTDGTLRNSKEDNQLVGLEFVLTAPLFGKDLLSAVKFICDLALKEKWKINYRTSMHLHQDVRGQNFDAFKNQCVTYALTEPYIYAWAGDRRDESAFCVPWYRAESDISNIRSLFSTQNSQIQEKASILNRYSGLNLHALSKFGSIEFRHLLTTFDYDKIVKWINIVQKLRAFADSMEQKGTIGYSIVEMLSQYGPADFCRAVYGSELGKELVDACADSRANECVCIAQDLLRDEISNGMGQLFFPVGGILSRGEHPGLKKWLATKSKKTPLPLGAINDIWVTRQFPSVSLQRGLDVLDGYAAHGFLPDENNVGKYLAFNCATGEPMLARNGRQIQYAITRRTGWRTIHSYLSAAWRTYVTSGSINSRIPVRLYTMQGYPHYVSPWVWISPSEFRDIPQEAPRERPVNARYNPGDYNFADYSRRAENMLRDNDDDNEDEGEF
jgi:hypothetical protein